MQSRELVIPQKHANVIWWAAWLSLGAAWHAVYIQQPGFGIVPTCVLCTSLNYWRNPVRTSWSRTVDIGVVWGSLCYQNAIALYETPTIPARLFRVYCGIRRVLCLGTFFYGAKHAARFCVRACGHSCCGQHRQHCVTTGPNALI